jgi:hypothetical protein
MQRRNGIARLVVVGVWTAGCIGAVHAESSVERGKYLTAITGCNDCHTPFKLGPKGPEPDMTRLLSGHPAALVMPTAPALASPWGWAGSITNTAFAGPWGVSYAANLTPHEGTGIGAWDEALFVKAIRSGKHLGAGRPITPPMPWPSYAQMTDSDLGALFACLRSITPIENQVPDFKAPAE